MSETRQETKQEQEQDLDKTENDREQGLVPSREAGPALDALIAEKVLGWTIVGDWYGTAWIRARFFPTDPPGPDAHTSSGKNLCPRFSADITAAWLIVEKLYEGRWYFALDLTSDSTWVVKIGAYPEVEAATAPLAICRAALAIGDIS